MKDIRIDPHTLERAEQRGTNPEEIAEVIETGLPIPAKHGRFGKTKVFKFGRHRLGKFYEEKKVEVYYTVHGDLVVTITVYVFYGSWR
ncbi:MAG: hypothetical protein HYT87_03305 [Nitrospirae bacterium]|nr:hypothetical protein [Nitrospirota bacterium]